jgi:hypothetical protein
MCEVVTKIIVKGNSYFLPTHAEYAKKPAKKAIKKKK